MSRHLDSCRFAACQGCIPDPNAKDIIKLKERLAAQAEISKAEYKRGQKYKRRRGELEEENKGLRAQVSYWKEQTDRWQEEFCNMTEIRDSFVKQRDQLQREIEILRAANYE